MELFLDFKTITLGIVVEALPFLLIGVLVSVAVDLFLKPEWIFKLIPKNRYISHFFVSTLGIFMPVCECGNVPVARRLLMYNLNVSHVITFLLAAPIINPITLWSTLEAFGFDQNVAIFRLIGALVIACTVGIILSFYSNQENFLTKKMKEDIENCHIHSHDENRINRALDVFEKEFLSTFKLLIIGSAIAGFTQTVVPREILENLGSSPVLSVVAMMLLAFVVSICANIDAFFALAYANTFTLGSLLSFMIFGPMIDMKMLAMLKNTFNFKLLLMVTIFVATYSFLIGLLINNFYV
ncbi:MAG: UPF0718 protein YcgR [Candidatus Dojkabacteria bacterium]|nr:MAG: UPF0718 protein YcgR [Candidatus Dojkabacteria bacterium]